MKQLWRGHSPVEDECREGVRFHLLGFAALVVCEEDESASVLYGVAERLEENHPCVNVINFIYTVFRYFFTGEICLTNVRNIDSARFTITNILT